MLDSPDTEYFPLDAGASPWGSWSELSYQNAVPVLVRVPPRHIRIGDLRDCLVRLRNGPADYRLATAVQHLGGAGVQGRL